MAGLVGNGCVDHSNSLVEKDETTVSKYEILLDVFEKLSSVIDQVFNQFEKDLEGVKEEHKAIRVELDTLIAESQGDVIGPLAQLTLAINKLVVDKVLKGRMDPENFYCIDKKISRMEKAFNGHYRYVRSFKSEEDREKAKEEWRALKTEIGCEQKHLDCFKRLYGEIKFKDYYGFDYANFSPPEDCGDEEDKEMFVELRSMYYSLKKLCTEC